MTEALKYDQAIIPENKNTANSLGSCPKTVEKTKVRTSIENKGFSIAQKYPNTVLL